MSNETLLLVLPTIEACVAAAIALLLYRSSKALVEAESIGGVPVKGMRVAGSAAIFVIALMLMLSATPRGDVLLSQGDARQLREGIGRIEDEAAELSNCYKLDPADKDCADRVARVLGEARRLKRWAPDDAKLN